VLADRISKLASSAVFLATDEFYIPARTLADHHEKAAALASASREDTNILQPGVGVFASADTHAKQAVGSGQQPIGVPETESRIEAHYADTDYERYNARTCEKNGEKEECHSSLPEPERSDAQAANAQEGEPGYRQEKEGQKRSTQHRDYRVLASDHQIMFVKFQKPGVHPVVDHGTAHDYPLCRNREPLPEQKPRPLANALWMFGVRLSDYNKSPTE
jgi:hypothetical protein